MGFGVRAGNPQRPFDRSASGVLPIRRSRMPRRPCGHNAARSRVQGKLRSRARARRRSCNASSDAAADDDRHARRPTSRPATAAKTSVAEQRGPEHLQVGERREQRGRRDAGTRAISSQCAMPANKPSTSSSPPSRHRQRVALEAPRQRQREAHRAHQRAVEERRVEPVAGQLARQQLVEGIEDRGAEQQHHGGMQHGRARPQQYEDADEADDHRDPARPRRLLAAGSAARATR